MSKFTSTNKSKRRALKNSKNPFSESTRKNIAAAAGFLCSIRNCLKPSTCVAMKPKGGLGSVNLGRASHIYAAAKKGPRPAPEEITPEKIANQSNGIWTCTGCGQMIDMLELEFSVEELFLMKRVRETAAKMAVSDPQVIECSRYIAPLQFDDVFWNHLPDLNRDSIRAALLKLKASAILNGNLWGLAPPDQFSLKPVARAITAMADGHKEEPSNMMSRPPLSTLAQRKELRRYASVRRQVKEIVDAWANQIPSDHPHHQAPYRPHVDCVNIQVSALNPRTKAIHEPPVWMVAEGYAQYFHSAEKGETLRLLLRWRPSHIHGLNWSLDIRFEEGKMHTSSDLKALLDIPKPNFPDCKWDEEFSAYEQFLQRLLEGWQPVGFVAMSRGGNLHRDDRMHPVPFDIELKIPSPILEECLHRCIKMRLAFELERDWGGWELKTSKEYFDRRLDRDVIKTASDALRRRLGPPPYSDGESPPLATFDKRDIKLYAYRGALIFKMAERRW